MKKSNVKSKNLSQIKQFTYVQGVKGESGKSLSSIFGQNQCLYYNKQYISRKPLISAFIWHPESGCGIIRRVPRLLAVKSIGGRGGFLTSFRAGGHGSLMIMPCPLSGCQIEAEIKGFLLRYRLFQLYQWFFQNISLNVFPDIAITPCTY